MQVALIPPTSMLYMITEQPLHMVIPEGLKLSAYRNFYKIMSQRPTATLMLDNGAFEATGPQGPLNNEQLVRLIFEYEIDKFVLPDYLANMGPTLAAAEQFLHVWNLHQQTVEQKPINFVAPIQGADLNELKFCIERFCQLEEDFEIPLTFGLPRWQADEIDRHIRLTLADWIAAHVPHPIHLLGLSPAWPSECMYHNELVSSIDTSAPFVWAAAGLRLGKDERPAERPTNYFSLDSRLVDEELAKQNIDVMRRWTGQ